MKIGELSRATEVSARSLRYYEQLGLITAQRQANGYREYGEPAVKTVSTIKTLIGLGFPMTLIEQILPCTEPDSPVKDCSALNQHIAQIRDDIDLKARRLLETRDTLTDFLSRSGEPPAEQLAQATERIRVTSTEPSTVTAATTR